MGEPNYGRNSQRREIRSSRLSEGELSGGGFCLDFVEGSLSKTHSVKIFRGSVKIFRGSVKTFRGSVETFRGSVKSFRGCVETFGGTCCLAVCIVAMLLLGGCSSTGNSSGYGASFSGRAGYSPVNHAREQLEWIRRNGKSLSEAELYYAQNTPWSGQSLTSGQRRRWIATNTDGIRQRSAEEAASSRQRLLERPRVMDSARDRWQEENRGQAGGSP